jgi:hypothetical protein
MFDWLKKKEEPVPAISHETKPAAAPDSAPSVAITAVTAPKVFVDGKEVVPGKKIKADDVLKKSISAIINNVKSTPQA